MFSQSPKIASPLPQSKLAPAYHYQKLHEEQIGHHKKLDFGILGHNKEFSSKNGTIYKSNFVNHSNRNNSNDDENDHNTQNPINSGKKYSEKNSKISDFLIKK